MTLPRSKVTTTVRILLGAMFLLSGANGFFHFMPMPPMSARAMEMLGALGAAGYFIPLLKGIEIVAAGMLLSGRFVPLGLTILAPIVVNVVAFHAALAPEGVAIPLLLAAAEAYLGWSYRDVFAPILRARSMSEPAARATLDANLVAAR